MFFCETLCKSNLCIQKRIVGKKKKKTSVSFTNTYDFVAVYNYDKKIQEKKKSLQKTEGNWVIYSNSERDGSCFSRPIGSCFSRPIGSLYNILVCGNRNKMNTLF